MLLSSRSATRTLLLPSLLTSLAACSGGGSSVEGKLTGRLNGKDVDMSVQADSGGAPLTLDALPGDPNVDIVRHWGLLGGNEYESSAGGGKCVADPCPDIADINIFTPPPLIYAGLWRNTQGIVSVSREEGASQTFFNGKDDHFEMTFDEPDFSSWGETTMVNTGKVYAVQERNGERLEFKGDFRLEFQCHAQSTWYRDCGNTRNEALKPNPIGRPYAENTCPAELVAPYEAAPSWLDKTTLKLGSLEVDCRETHGAGVLLCYQRRKSVSAGGCKWTVHFLTDGALQQFAIAGFAEEGCAQRTCNTYR